jgi:cytidylate kinase
MVEKELLAHLKGNIPLSQKVEKARMHWAAPRQPDPVHGGIPSENPKAFTIALSREVGAMGTAIAEEVGKLLGWHVYDHELLEIIAKDMGLRMALMESMDEKNQSWLLDLAEWYVNANSKSDWGSFATGTAYVHHLIETMLALSIHGKCIIVGRGAAFVLPAATTLRIRLVAPVKDRVARISRKLGISETNAAHKVRSIDRERSDFVRDHFLKDPTDPHNFDLILNVSRLSVQHHAELIIEMLHRLQEVGKDRAASAETS